MTLQQLRYVIAVADHGSMNEAAKALFISQNWKKNLALNFFCARAEVLL